VTKILSIENQKLMLELSGLTAQSPSRRDVRVVLVSHPQGIGPLLYKTSSSPLMAAS